MPFSSLDKFGFLQIKERNKVITNNDLDSFIDEL
jgi:hypothetical protein